MRKRGRQRELWKKEPKRNRVIGYIQVEGKPSRRPVLARMDELEELSEQEVALLLSERYKLALAKHEAVSARLPASKTTFQSATQTYLDEKIWSEDDLKPYVTSFNKFVESCGDFELATWSNKLNQKFVNDCKKVNLAESTINKHQRHIQGAFNWLHEYRSDLLPNPIKIEKIAIHILKKQPDGEPTIWSTDEISHYRSEIERHGNLNHLRTFMLARFQIMRLSEIWSLPLSRMDLKDGFIVIDHVQDFPKEGKRVKVKKKQTRKIEVHPTLLQWLRYDKLARGPEEKWWLDNGQGRPAFIQKNSITAALRRFRNIAGLKGDPVHCFRRTGITEMLEGDAKAVKVMALAGHYSMDTTLGHYVNRSALEGSKALAKIS